MKFRTLALALVLCTVSAFAADVDGNWSGAISTPNGDFPVSYTFKADGAKLTGTLINMDGPPVPLTDGKIDGSNITFTVTIDFGGMPLVFNYKGVVSATEIKLSTDFMGMPFEYTLKKAK
jgi:hypothetical protein